LFLPIFFLQGIGVALATPLLTCRTGHYKTWQTSKWCNSRLCYR